MTSADIVALSCVVARAQNFEQRHPHLRLDALSPEIQQMIGRTVDKAIGCAHAQGRTTHDKYVYLAILEMFGVDCPHGDRKPWQIGNTVGGASVGRQPYECNICGTIVIMQDTG